MVYFSKAKEIKSSEKGSMTIEVVVSFMVFILFVGFMVNLINIYTFHNRMQYALNAAAHDIASFSYLLYVKTGLKGFEKQVVGDGAEHVDANNATVDQVFDTCEQFYQIATDLDAFKDFVQSPDETYQMVNDSVDMVMERGSNLRSTFIGMLYGCMEAGLNKGKALGGAAIAETLVPVYMDVQDLNFNTAKSYEELQRVYYVKNVNYAGTEIFPYGSSLIKLQVQYDVDVSFFNLRMSSGGEGFLSGILGKNEGIHIVQCAVASGWNDGDGTYIE